MGIFQADFNGRNCSLFTSTHFEQFHLSVPLVLYSGEEADGTTILATESTPSGQGEYCWLWYSRWMLHGPGRSDPSLHGLWPQQNQRLSGATGKCQRRIPRACVLDPAICDRDPNRTCILQNECWVYTQYKHVPLVLSQRDSDCSYPVNPRLKKWN